MKSVKGVYTVEAALILPLVLFIMVISVRLGVALYQDTVRAASEYKEVQEYDEIKTIHRIRFLGNAWEALSAS